MRILVRIVPLVCLWASMPADSAWAAVPETNPFAKPSTLPFEAPPFDRIKDTDFQPAIEAGMTDELAEIDMIANNAAAPDFDNTIGAMARTGALLNRTFSLFHNLVSANTNPTLDKVNLEEAPRLAAHQDAILLNAKLFQRVKSLHDRAASLGLDAARSFLLERTYQRFVRAGALLSDADKDRLRQLNGEIAKLETEYTKVLRDAASDAAVVVTDKADLAGLSDAEISATAAAATARHLDGKYLIAITNTTQQPILGSLINRKLRTRILEASESRGDRAGKTDERDRIATLAMLRAQKAKLLGYPSYASFVLADQMARTPDRAETLLRALVPASVAKAKEEAAEIQGVIDTQKLGYKLAAQDWEFFAGQVQKSKYDIDLNEVKQYFELDRVLNDGVFYAANKLYGLTFKPRTDLPVYQPGVQVYEVFDADGKTLALFYADYYARPNKDGGAWCDYLNDPNRIDKRLPIIINNANFVKPPAGSPTLLSYDDVVTMFHEFGHALHAMFSVQDYAAQNGFNMPTDVIEFPSQFNEHWALYPDVFAHFARHHETGEVMPQALVDKIKKARYYGQGYKLTELLAAMLLDLDWHSLSADAPKQIPDLFEAASLKRNGIDFPPVPPRYRSPYFLHIWGNGYSANYYSYMWGEILDDDAFEWFKENGGLTRENGQRFRDRMLGPGYTADPMAQYRDFRGRDPNVEAVKRARGLVADADAPPPIAKP